MATSSHDVLLGPVAGALDALAPECVRRVGALLDIVGLVRGELPVELPGLAEVLGRVPDAGAEAGHEGCPERGRLDDLRPLDGYAEQVGLELAEQVVRRCTAVDHQGRQLRGHRVGDVADLEGDRLEVARTRWARVVPRVMPRMVPRACGSQW